ncbi:hypothetical protein LEP1GSC111_3289 [Leptospira interrogans str. UT126]|nr:hypothetical protein LEP1GSC111_3289 [Leptospira interrogans str. UT126]
MKFWNSYRLFYIWTFANFSAVFVYQAFKFREKLFFKTI